MLSCYHSTHTGVSGSTYSTHTGVTDSTNSTHTGVTGSTYSTHTGVTGSTYSTHTGEHPATTLFTAVQHWTAIKCGTRARGPSVQQPQESEVKPSEASLYTVTLDGRMPLPTLARGTLRRKK